MRLELANCIRSELSDQRLPKWVIDIFGLNEMSKFSDLPSDLKVNSPAELKAVNHYVQSLINRRMRDSDLRKKRCFPHSPLTLDKALIESLNLSVRTKNAFMSHWVSNDASIPLSDLTYEDLFRTPNLGAKSVLEFLYQTDNYGLNSEATLPGKEDDSTLNESIKAYIAKLKIIDDIEHIYKADPRFSEINVILPIPEYEKDNSLSDLLIQSYDSFSTWPKGDKHRLNELLKATYEKIQYMETRTIELLFQDLIRCVYSGKNRNLLAMYERFGINNEGIKTLEECGTEAGVTRERIRQIESKILKSINAIPGDSYVYMPKLDKAINIIRDNIGSSVTHISKKFIENGISDIGISVYSILYFGNILRYPVSDLKITNLEKIKDKVVVGSNVNVNAIFAELSKLYSRNGIADFQLIQAHLENNKFNMNYDEAKNLIEASHKWKALDDNKRWWIPIDLTDIARNRLVNVARKILSVNGTIEIEDLRNGFIKMAIYRNASGGGYRKNKITVPSSNAMLNFFNVADDFSVENTKVSSNINLDYKEELAEVERAIADVLIKSSTGILTRSELFKGVVDQGINENSASLYISYSPIVQHIGSDSYTIIGKKPLASDYSAHLDTVSDKKKNKGKRLLLCDWDEGLIRIVIRCPEITANLVVGSPSPVKPMLLNRTFEAWDIGETERYANIGVNEQGTIYGMNSFCRQAGIEENDILVMKFNLLESKVYLSIGSIDEYLDLL